MPERMTDEQLAAELTRAQQLAEICRNNGYPQAATLYHQTARAIDGEIAARAAAQG